MLTLYSRYFDSFFWNLPIGGGPEYTFPFSETHLDYLRDCLHLSFLYLLGLTVD